MLKLTFLGLFIALLGMGFYYYGSTLSSLKQLQQTNQQLTAQVEKLTQQLALSELEQQRLKQTLAKHEAAKIKQLYE